MSEHLMTDAEMAERIGKSLGFVQARCPRKDPAWPHLRIGRSIRFTPEQVAQIEALLTVAPPAPAEPAAAWGRRGRTT